VTLTSRIFISYRRDDAAGEAGRLHDALSARFGRDSVFMDVDTIQPGANFTEVISQAIGSCEVLVTVIGKSWLSLADAGGERRLDDMQDLVRLEIQSALEQNIRVIPALVQGARMPRADQLPGSIAKLAGRNAFEISHTRWQVDVERLIAALEQSTSQTSAPLDNLPRQLTSFVGRGDDVTAVKQTLSSARLLTLTGTGGIGKTRLALQAANELVKTFRDGVWLVELAPIAAPELVPKAVSIALGVPERSSQEVAETLAGYLGNRQVLLVLDNCEHVVEAVARLAEVLLRACPELRILVTSRELLGIDGEQVHRVRSLSVPDAAIQTEAESAREYEAVALFRDRATTAVDSFKLTDKSTPLVVQVCQRLDGIPLAIELAAARLKVLSLDQIVHRLDDRFRLLTGGSRTALPRQKTLRATIDWSYGLLTEPERVLLRRLSVFAGSASLDAVEASCSGEPVNAGDVLDLLTELISKSMVVVGDSGTEARYQLLETIRQYGHDQLGEAGETDDVRRQHRDWFLSLTERAEAELQGPDQLNWSELLELELENLRAAFEWSMQVGDAESSLRLATALGRFWLVRGHLTQGEDWLKRALVTGAGPPSLRAKALVHAARLATYLGDDERAERLGNKGLELFRDAADDRGVGFALRTLGLVAVRQDEFEKARALHEEGLVVVRDLDDKAGIALSLYSLGQVMTYIGDHATAETQLEQALVMFRELGDSRFVALTLRALATEALFQGRYAAAAHLLNESMELLRELNDQGSVALGLMDLGTVQRCLRNFDLANELLEESLASFRMIGQDYPAAYSLCELGIIARLQGDLERSRALLQECLSVSGDRYGLSRCLEALGGLACRQDQQVRAARLFGAAEAIREAIASPLDPYDVDDHEAFVASAKSAMGEAELSKAWLEGKAMTQEEAIAFAAGQG
jgi:predicted ATPase